MYAEKKTFSDFLRSAFSSDGVDVLVVGRAVMLCRAE
jgi:hypothetical protein